MLNKFQLLTKVKNRTYGKFPQLSYSRSGEDLILEEILGNNNFNGFYVDIGAYHPIEFSNTYKFYLKGWNGINIDANCDVIEMFNRYRKRDVNVNVAIGAVYGKVNYYMFNEDSSINTISEEFKNMILQEGKNSIKETRVIDVVPLSKLFDTYISKDQRIDFLSVDVEGVDLEVLKTNNWNKYRPKVVVVETSDPLDSLNESATTIFLREKGYKHVAYSLVTMNAGNIYFIDEQSGI